ncbi:MAG: hypothetical protein Q8S31_04405 [Alphaproteobacteria bacterium]|nr:hypothetical protein [Alphaproteobacteria bacterium]
MKKAYLLLAVLAAPIFSSTLYALGDEDKQEIILNNYSDQSFYHDSNIIGHIDTLVEEGKTLLGQLYNNEDLVDPSLNLAAPWLELTKYAPWREKLAIVSGGFRLAKSYAKNWLYGEDQTEKKRKDYLTKITTMMWGIFSESVDKKEGFVRGSYKIIDPDFKLYNFLLDYVKLVTGSEDPKLLPYGCTSSNHGYRRSPRLKGSSHYKLECKNDEQFGIDIRRENYETTLKILPASKTHILFGRLTIPGSNLPITFVKFEEVGMGGLGEFFDHSLNFGASGHNLTDADRREKDVVIDVRLAFEAACAFFITNNPELTLVIDNDLLQKLKTKGMVYEMIQFLNEKFSAENEFDSIMSNFYDMLGHNGYEKQVAEIRNGNEVILDHNFFIYNNEKNENNINLLVDLLKEDNSEVGMIESNFSHIDFSSSSEEDQENKNIIIKEQIDLISYSPSDDKENQIDETQLDPSNPEHAKIIQEIKIKKQYGRMDLAGLKHAKRMTEGRLKHKNSASYDLDLIHIMYINQYILELESQKK